MSEQTSDRDDKPEASNQTVKDQSRTSKAPDPACGSNPDEEALFGAGTGPRLFGEGGYADGGSNQEGNWERRATHPHGGYGRFSDAGGPGATQLLGEVGFGEGETQKTPDTGTDAQDQPQGREDRTKKA